MSSWFYLYLDTSQPVPPPPAEGPQAGEGGHPFTFVPVTRPREEFAASFAGSVSLAREVALTISGLTPLPPFEHRLSGNLSFSREVDLRIRAERESSPRLAQIAEEDEIILLSL